MTELSWGAEGTSHIVVVRGLSFITGGDAGGEVEVVELGGGTVNAVVGSGTNAGETSGITRETLGGVGVCGAGG